MCFGGHAATGQVRDGGAAAAGASLVVEGRDGLPTAGAEGEGLRVSIAAEAAGMLRRLMERWRHRCASFRQNGVPVPGLLIDI